MGNNEKSKITIKVETETKELDVAIEKAKELVSLLERSNKLIQSLGTIIINNYTN